MQLDPALLDELARCFVQAALTQLLAESESPKENAHTALAGESVQALRINSEDYSSGISTTA